MLRTTVGQLLVNRALPEGMRDYTRALDGKTVEGLLQKIADEHPDSYREASKKLLDVGRSVALETGGFTFGLSALRQAKAAKAASAEMRMRVDRLLDDADLDDDAKGKAIVEMIMSNQSRLEKDILEESKLEGNPLALQIASGSRGKPMNLKSLRGGDLLYTDHHDNPIPIPVLRSYSQGLTPSEYFAGSFGARKGVTDTKFATQNAGYLSKVMNQAVHRLVTGRRDDEDPKRLEGRGLPVDVDDSDNEGSLLAIPAAGYPRNTLMTSRVMADMKAKGVKRIAVRSPLVSGAADGTIYGRDLGVRERGGLPAPGDHAGLAAAQAISEPVSQGMLSSKHSGGVAGASKVSGFKYLNQMIQSPKVSPYWAAHAQSDGQVAAVREAPAGGWFVVVAGKEHYVPADAKLSVKVGDRVEAGDMLSDGLPNPTEFVRHKGIGEGRRQYVEAFRKGMKEAGMGGHRRNIELLTRGLVNHVRLSEAVGDYEADEVVPYDEVERAYLPRDGYRQGPARSMVNRYLDRPVLHYSVGTRVTPSVVKELDEFGVGGSVVAHDDPPPFSPHYVRGLDNLQHDPDWMTQMLGSNLGKSFQKSVERGAVSDEGGTSFVPSLARAVDFGRGGKVFGFDPARVARPEPGKGVL